MKIFGADLYYALFIAGLILVASLQAPKAVLNFEGTITERMY